jgi:hypothetical protein
MSMVTREGRGSKGGATNGSGATVLEQRSARKVGVLGTRDASHFVVSHDVVGRVVAGMIN